MDVKKRKFVLVGVSFLALIVYHVITDPDLGIIKNLPFGGELVLFFNVVLATFVLVLMGDLVLDFYTDEIDDLEEKLIKKGMLTAEGAALVYLGKGVKFLGVCVVMYGAMQVYG